MKRIQKLADELRSKFPSTVPNGDAAYLYHHSRILLIERHLEKTDPNFSEDSEILGFRADVMPVSDFKSWRVGYKGFDGKMYQKTITEDELA